MDITIHSLSLFFGLLFCQNALILRVYIHGLMNGIQTKYKRMSRVQNISHTHMCFVRYHNFTIYRHLNTTLYITCVCGIPIWKQINILHVWDEKPQRDRFVKYWIFWNLTCIFWRVALCVLYMCAMSFTLDRLNYHITCESIPSADRWLVVHFFFCIGSI